MVINGEFDFLTYHLRIHLFIFRQTKTENKLKLNIIFVFIYNKMIYQLFFLLKNTFYKLLYYVIV